MALAPFTGPLQLGAWPLGAPVDFLGGWLDDVRIYSRALSPAEIARDMAMPIGGGRAPDTEAPRVQIDSIADGDTVAEVVTIGAVAADDVGVVGVTFHVDGVALGTEVTAPVLGDVEHPNGRRWGACDPRRGARHRRQRGQFGDSLGHGHQSARAGGQPRAGRLGWG